MNRSRLLTAALLATLLLAAGSRAGRAADEDRKFILVVVDGVLWPDYADVGGRALSTLCHAGALGLMNVRTGAWVSPESGYLTIGAGSRAVAPASPLALQVGEEYEDIQAVSAFESRTGQIPPHGGAVYLAVAAADRLNAPEELRYICRPGLLGSALAGAGITAACIGNADSAQQPSRNVVAIAMDEQGIVPLAVVDRRVTRAASGFAPGVETDFGALLRAFDRVVWDAQFIAIETGDTARLHALETELSPQLVAQERRRRLLRVDAFLGHLLERAQDRPWRILLVTPSPPQHSDRTTDTMTPIILTGWRVAAGLLTSPSTRTPGVVANTDIAPSVLDFFGIKAPVAAVGRPIAVRTRPSGRALAAVLDLDRRWAADDRNRPPARDTLKAVIVIILVLACFGLLLDVRTPPALAGLLRGLSLFVISAPLALLLLALHPPRTLWGVLAAMFLLSILIAALASLHRRGWLWVTLATVVLIAGDVLFRQTLVSGSVLGYAPTVGARYYGLGNEYGGVVLAAVPIGILGLLGAGAPARRWQRLAIGLLLAAAALIAGHPAAGANFGIGLSCAVGFAITLGLLSPGGISPRRVLAVALLGAAALAAVVLADLARGGAASHIGRAAADVGAGGSAALADIAVRRTMRNWLLVQRSAWSSPAALGLITLTIALLAAPRRVLAAFGPRRPLLAALGGAAAGAAAAFLLNDSGIVSAALALSYAAAVLTYLSFSERLHARGS